MNSFGRVFRVSIFGESHGPVVGVVIDGVPAGIPLGVNDFRTDMLRRRAGKLGTTKRVDRDEPCIQSGVFDGRTTGAPVTITFPNEDVRPSDYEEIRYLPRPGHADMTARQKYWGFNDYRGGGHFSGRLTAGLVAAGVVAKKVIRPIKVHAYIEEIGGTRTGYAKLLEELERAGDSVGAVVRCSVRSVPVGLGEPFFDSVESLLAHALFSIPGVKGIEFGAGFACARMRGSEFNDEIIDTNGRTATNNSGGLNGGITNGNEIVLRLAVRPTASISLPQRTVDLRTGERTELRVRGRHDVCIALRFPPIVEAMVAITLADLLLIRYGYERWQVIFQNGGDTRGA
ncbi:chorismate synthase [Fervidobacterium thailandense]|uniref:Chorismate synthase n=1 Tax=Fervidobacterium thailandense TaxID=1008305 RepID=A0A1E3G196_9BACT|nr:chorismate synthase [Fervidobacterium thailandense]ODN30016.1 chorismate synthase [Fervidobacterium thailandense]